MSLELGVEKVSDLFVDLPIIYFLCVVNKSSLKLDFKTDIFFMSLLAKDIMCRTNTTLITIGA